MKKKIVWAAGLALLACACQPDASNSQSNANKQQDSTPSAPSGGGCCDAKKSEPAAPKVDGKTAAPETKTPVVSPTAAEKTAPVSPTAESGKLAPSQETASAKTETKAP